MLRFRKILLLLPAALVLLPAASRAAMLPTYDLTTDCFRSTDVVEARLTRHHLPGREEWNDTFTATVTNPLEGRFHAGDYISGLDLTLYDPADTGQQCILFLASNTLDSPAPSRAPPSHRHADCGSSRPRPPLLPVVKPWRACGARLPPCSCCAA